MSKYRARKTEYGGQTYDSAAEAQYAERLELRRLAGDIRWWTRAAPIVLVPGKRKDRITYKPDFWVVGADGSGWFVDVKGVVLPIFRIKLKLLRHVRPDIRLLIVDAGGKEMDL